MSPSESSTSTNATGRTTTDWLSVRARNTLRYLLVGAAIVGAYHFLAPAAGLPMWGWYQSVTPSVIAPTEGDAIVDAMHAIVMTTAAALAARL